MALSISPRSSFHGFCLYMSFSHGSLFRIRITQQRNVSIFYWQWIVAAHSISSIESYSVKTILRLVCGIFVTSLLKWGLAVKADSRASLPTIRRKERMRPIETELYL